MDEEDLFTGLFKKETTKYQLILREMEFLPLTRSCSQDPPVYVRVYSIIAHIVSSDRIGRLEEGNNSQFSTFDGGKVYG